MTLEELSVVTQKPLRASYYSRADCRWYLFLEGAVVIEDGADASTYGVGESFDEARSMYVDRIRGKVLLFGKARTAYSVPHTLH